MAHRPPFGRRALPATRTVPSRAPLPAGPPPPLSLPDDDSGLAPLSVETELQAWKAARPRPPLPWRQILFMASLCFGIASFVLPDGVSAVLQDLLYGLTAASFLAGLRRKKS